MSKALTGSKFLNNPDSLEVGYQPAGTGAVATTVQSKLRESVSVKDFGAVGDGVVDDTAAIQAAVDSTTNGTVFIPDGIYLVSAPISLPYNVSLRGSSTAGATLKMKNGANAAAVLQTKNFALLTGTTSTAGTLLTYIGDFTIDGNKANNTSGVGVRLYGKGYTFSNVMIHSCASIGLYTEYNGPDDFSSINGTIESIYENLSIQQNGGDGWYAKGPHDLSCSKIFSFSNGSWGWVVETSVKASSVNTYLNTNGGIWVRLSGVITGSDVTGNTGGSGFGMLIDTGTGATNISSGYFGGGGPGKAALAIRSPNHNIHGIVVMAGTGFGGDATNAGVRFEGNGSAKLDLMMSNLNCYWFVLSGDSGGNSNVSVATQSVAGTLFSGTPNSIGTWHIAGGDNAHRFTQLSTQTINAGGWAPKLPASNGTLVPVSYTSPTYSSSITFDVGSKHYFLINPSNSSAFTINAPTGGANGHIITVSIQNGTAGALGTITWASNFKLAGGSFTSPGAYKMRSVTFVCIGSDWYELHRTSADV